MRSHVTVSACFTRRSGSDDESRGSREEEEEEEGGSSVLITQLKPEAELSWEGLSIRSRLKTRWVESLDEEDEEDDEDGYDTDLEEEGGWRRDDVD